MRKRWMAILSLMLAAMFVLAACAPQSPTPTPQPGGETAAPAQQPTPPVVKPQDKVAGISEDAELKIALSAEPNNLLPLYAETKASAAVNMCLYDTLVFWNMETSKPEPRLATSWEWENDSNGQPTRLRFKLREDIYTSGGHHITAEDVRYSFELATLGNQANIISFLDVANFEVEDDYTIVLKTYSPYPTLLDRIGNDMYSIVSKEAVEAAGGYEAALRNPLNIGTGKYVFDKWVDGQYITLVRNDNYWDPDNLPYYKYITFTFINDTASRAMSVESGDVDIASEIQASQVPALQANADLTVNIHNMSTNRTFYMNCSTGPLANLKVREAIFYLLNADAVKAISNGGFGSLSETNFSQFNPYYSAPPADYVREVNVEKAKQLLAEAGYPDGFELTFMTVATSKATAEIVQENLRLGGITLNVDLLEVGAYIGNLIGGNYETYIGSADNWDAANLLRAVDGRLPTPVAFGGAQYKDDALAALIDQAYTQIDDAQRYAAYAAVQDYVRDNYVVIGLCNEIRTECYTSDLTGLTYDMRGYAIYQDMAPIA